MPFQFEDFVLDPERRELRRADTLVAIEPQVFDLLLHLVRNREGLRPGNANDRQAALANRRGYRGNGVIEHRGMLKDE